MSLVQFEFSDNGMCLIMKVDGKIASRFYRPYLYTTKTAATLVSELDVVRSIRFDLMEKSKGLSPDLEKSCWALSISLKENTERYVFTMFAPGAYVDIYMDYQAAVEFLNKVICTTE